MPNIVNDSTKTLTYKNHSKTIKKSIFTEHVLKQKSTENKNRKK